MKQKTPTQIERENAILLNSYAAILSRGYVSKQDHAAATVALMATALELICKKHGTPCKVIFGSESV